MLSHAPIVNYKLSGHREAVLRQKKKSKRWNIQELKQFDGGSD